MDDIRLIVGLGNPGRQYHRTRHNVGFDTIDLLAAKLGVGMDKEKFSASFGQTFYEDKKLILLKPLEFMNNSGRSVSAAANFYKIQPCQIMVITDDLALEPEVIRLRAAGSAGGHNGLSDIVEKLATNKFSRLRIGIGSRGSCRGRDYVLSVPGEDERILIDRAIERAVGALLVWAGQGIDEAMSQFNARPQNE